MDNSFNQVLDETARGWYYIFDSAPADPVLTLSKLMEDKTLVENLKKKVSELTEAIKSGAADQEKANVMIESAELIVKAIAVQLEYEDLGGEIIGELPSREELGALNDLIGVTKNEIRITSEAR